MMHKVFVFMFTELFSQVSPISMLPRSSLSRKAATRRLLLSARLLLSLGVFLLALLLLYNLTRSNNAHGRSPQLQQAREQRPALLAFVGVQTGFTTDPRPKYNYAARRQALRASWFPGSRQALDSLEREGGVVVRFVVGHSADAAQEAQMAEEEAVHRDFLRLEGLVEGYAGLPTKTLLFLRAVTQQYDAQYILKVDDDVYLRLDRVPHAVPQWRHVGADYVGCFKTGGIIKSPKYRWFEPQHALLGGASYFAHAWGSAYLVSGRVAADLAVQRDGSLRQFANEDVTIGAWMLAFNTTPFDDRRMCEPNCTATSLAVYDMPTCAGLCDPAAQLPQLHASSACKAAATDASGSVPLLPPILWFASASGRQQMVEG